MSEEATAAYSTFSAAYSIGFSKRPEIFQDIESPGPQAYTDINLNVSKQRSPQWRISESKKVSVFDANNMVPSPGVYEVSNNMGKGTSYTIQTPFKSKEEPTKVSPALYSPNTNYIKKTLPAISLTSRMGPQIKKTYEETPGVGSYNLTDRKKDGQSGQGLFGFAEKDSIYRNEVLNFPAPNQYQIQEPNLVSSPSFRFQKSKRQELINRQYEQNGPGSYNINRDFIQQKYISNSPQQKSEHQSSKHLKQQSQSLSEAKMDTLPGPGAYEHNLPSLQNSSYYKTCKFGMSPRLMDMSRNSNPGPGAYILNSADRKEKNMRQTRVYTFGEAKKNNYEVSLTPGPGQYNVPQNMGKGPKYGMNKGSHSQPSFIKKSDSPGPAAYVLNETQIRPSPFSVKFNSKTEGNDTQKAMIPGPGHYNIPDESFNHSKISFGQNAIRDAFGTKDGPGPSSYEIKSQIAGLPDYHKKQMEYFQGQIKVMRETMRDQKSLKSSQMSLLKQSTYSKPLSTPRQLNYLEDQTE